MAALVSTPMMATVTTNSMSVNPRTRMLGITSRFDGDGERLRRRIRHRYARRSHRGHLRRDGTRRAGRERFEAQLHEAAFALDGILGRHHVHLRSSAFC